MQQKLSGLGFWKKINAFRHLVPSLASWLVASLVRVESDAYGVRNDDSQSPVPTKQTHLFKREHTYIFTYTLEIVQKQKHKTIKDTSGCCARQQIDGEACRLFTQKWTPRATHPLFVPGILVACSPPTSCSSFGLGFGVTQILSQKPKSPSPQSPSRTHSK